MAAIPDVVGNVRLVASMSVPRALSVLAEKLNN